MGNLDILEKLCVNHLFIKQKELSPTYEKTYVLFFDVSMVVQCETTVIVRGVTNTNMSEHERTCPA